MADKGGIRLDGSYFCAEQESGDRQRPSSGTCVWCGVGGVIVEQSGMIEGYERRGCS